jgi:hypothetical protein
MSVGQGDQALGLVAPTARFLAEEPVKPNLPEAETVQIS